MKLVSFPDLLERPGNETSMKLHDGRWSCFQAFTTVKFLIAYGPVQYCSAHCKQSKTGAGEGLETRLDESDNKPLEAVTQNVSN